MKDQRPGQIFTPQSSNTDLPANRPADLVTPPPVPEPVVKEEAAPGSQPVAPKTPDEIAQIEMAMQQQPPVAPEPAAVAEPLTPTPSVPSVSDRPLSPSGTPPQPLPEEVATDPADYPTAPAVDQTDDAPLLSWQAAEPVSGSSSSRQVLVYGGVGLLVTVALFVVGGFNFSSVLSAVAVILGVVALIVSNRRHGHLESYALYEDGITLGERHYSFSDLRAFSMMGDTAQVVELIPTKRFSPSLSVNLEPKTEEQVLDILMNRLPFEERKPDTVDRLSRRLKL
ncbi:MAG: hypothetical protein WD467_01970 [Candidatus Saccharimonadales bacterium]